MIAARGSAQSVAAGWCVLVASITAAAVFITTWTPDWSANDTAQTLSVARNLAFHGEIATDVIYYEEHLQFSGSRVPQTVFPPGYPAAIALLMQFGLSDVVAAQIIVTLAFAAIPVLLFVILQRLGTNAISSAVIGLSWLAMQPMWWNAQGLQSELPFIACTLCALACVQRSETTARASRWLIAAGVWSALACSFRYAGFFFVLSVGLVLAGDWLRTRTRPGFWRCMAFSGLPFLTLASMFARNAWLVGDLKGGNNHLTVKPIGEVVRTTWYSISDLCGWSRVGVSAGEASELLLLAGIACFVGSIIMRIVMRHSRVDDRKSSTCSAFIPLVYCVVVIAGMFWLERTTSVGLCPRLLLPVVPFALIAFGQFGNWIAVEGRNRSFGFATVALVIVAMFTGQMELWARHQQPSIVRDVRAAVDSLATRSAGSQPIDIVAFADGQPVLCNECHCVSNAVKLPVVGLAAENYTSRHWNHDTVRELVDRYDVRLVLVFPSAIEEANESTLYFEALLAGDVPDWLTPIVTEGPVSVFVVK